MGAPQLSPLPPTPVQSAPLSSPPYHKTLTNIHFQSSSPRVMNNRRGGGVRAGRHWLPSLHNPLPLLFIYSLTR